MTESELMSRAIAVAQESEEPLKCGCIIAKDGEIIASAFNSQRNDHDATAHDGIKAIALAGKKLGKKDLENCEAYCTHEPCTMCLSAMIFAKISVIRYAISLSDVSGLHKRIHIDAEELIAKSPRPVRVLSNFMKKDVRAVLGPFV